MKEIDIEEIDGIIFETYELDECDKEECECDKEECECDKEECGSGSCGGCG